MVILDIRIWSYYTLEYGHIRRYYLVILYDNLIGRQPQWKTTPMEDNLNGRQSQWKTTSMEDDLNER